MYQKKTSELLEELKKSGNIKEYFDHNRDELSNIELKGYLDGLLIAKGVKRAQAIRRSGLNDIYAYQIFSGLRHPTRDKIISLCFGMELTVDEAQHLLNKAGVAELYPRNSRDSIILHALKNGLSVIECDTQLSDLGENPLNTAQ